MEHGRPAPRIRSLQGGGGLSLNLAPFRNGTEEMQAAPTWRDSPAHGNRGGPSCPQDFVGPL